MIWLYCFAFVLILFPLVVYPLLMWLRSLPARHTTNPPDKTDELPTVDLIICAYNEERNIGAKIANALSLDYPADRLHIWLASDGSSDATVDLARSFDNTRITVLDLPRQGKATALTEAVSLGEAEILAFSDANSMWQADALTKMTRHFCDSTVGGVAGNQVYQAGQSNESSGERSYWALDRLLKVWQSAAASVTSATGAIYCVRRALFEPPPIDATDDFMISTGVIAQGQRLVFEQKAIAIEDAADVANKEFSRKVRITTRGLRGVYYRRKLLNPCHYGLYAFQLGVHKLWRRLVWMPLLVMIILAPFLLNAWWPVAGTAYALLTSVALALCGAGLTASRSIRIISIATYIYMVNTACAIACYNFISGKNYARWNNLRAETEIVPTEPGTS